MERKIIKIDNFLEIISKKNGILLFNTVSSRAIFVFLYALYLVNNNKKILLVADLNIVEELESLLLEHEMPERWISNIKKNHLKDMISLCSVKSEIMNISKDKKFDVIIYDEYSFNETLNKTEIIEIKSEVNLHIIRVEKDVFKTQCSSCFLGLGRCANDDLIDTMDLCTRADYQVIEPGLFYERSLKTFIVNTVNLKDKENLINLKTLIIN